MPSLPTKHPQSLKTRGNTIDTDCVLRATDDRISSFLRMDEKIKIRYNYLFEYNKGPKRVFFKKQDSSGCHHRIGR